VRLVVDTGVFSAALSMRRRSQLDRHVRRLVGNQLFLAAVSVAELRYGALVAGWAPDRRHRLDQVVAATTVIPVTDALLTTAAELRYECRQLGHPLENRVHANDLWIAASAVHLGLPLITADQVFAGVPGLTILG
jgi:tRNA(fMet)-specific endonuclease VapC